MNTRIRFFTKAVACSLALAAAIAAARPLLDDAAESAVLPTTPAKASVLRWSVGLQGGTLVETGPGAFERQGGVEHFSEQPAVLDPALANLTEKTPPAAAHLELVALESAGVTIYTFMDVGGAEPALLARGESAKFCNFWTRADSTGATPAGVVPAVGVWEYGGGRPTVGIRASAPENAPTAVIACATTTIGAVRIVRYFVDTP